MQINSPELQPNMLAYNVDAVHFIEECYGKPFFIPISGATGPGEKKRGWTQLYVAEQVSVSVDAVRRWESGTTLVFTIDTEVHKLTVVPLQPAKVGIETYCQGAGNWITVNNFSYLAKAN